MNKQWMSKTALVALVLACASTGARAEFITFDANLAAYYTPPAPPTSFSTVGSGAGTYSVAVGPPGFAAVGSGAFASSLCGTGGNTCSDNGTQALYVSSSNPGSPGSGMITLTPASGFLLAISAFDAAIASTQPGACLLDLGFGCIISTPDLTLSTDIQVSGIRGAGFGANPTTIDFELSPPGNETFATLTLADFINLDSLTFAFNGTTAFCDAGCSGDFALDNLNVTSTLAPINPPPPPPNNVPEPATLGLLAAGLIGLGLTRRRKQRAA